MKDCLAMLAITACVIVGACFIMNNYFHKKYAAMVSQGHIDVLNAATDVQKAAADVKAAVAAVQGK